MFHTDVHRWSKVLVCWPTVTAGIAIRVLPLGGWKVAGSWLEGGWKVAERLLGGGWKVAGSWLESGWKVAGGWLEGG
jgi:hypothetical protein